MPSATANTSSATSVLSWFTVRTWPTSVAAPAAKRVTSTAPVARMPPRPIRDLRSCQLQHRVTDLDPVARLHDHRAGQAVAVQVGAVRRTQILDDRLTVVGVDAGVHLGNERVVHCDLAVR